MPKNKNPDLGLKGDGVEKKSIPEIEDAAYEYIQQRDKRMALTPKEVEAKKTLLDTMHRHKLKHYEYEDDNGKLQNIDVVQSDETVKVKAARGEDDPEE